MISDEQFSNCAFLAANGCDIQPLLRLTPLLEPVEYKDQGVFLFISSTLGVPKTIAEAKSFFIGRVKVLNEKYGDCLRLVDEPMPIEVDFLNGLDKPLPPEVFEIFWKPLPDTEPVEYDHELDQLIGPIWGAEFTFERIGLNTPIKFLHFSTEATELLWKLSRGGQFAPKLISTVQTGLLQKPDGPLEKILAHFDVLPEFWIKGQWAYHDIDRFGPDSDWLNLAPITPEVLCSGRYRHLAQRYPHWDSQFDVPDGMDAEDFSDPAKSIVFATSSNVITPAAETNLTGLNSLRQVQLIAGDFETDAHSVHIVSERLKDRLGPLPEDIILLSWREFSDQIHMPIKTFRQALQAIDTYNGSRFRIIPLGFEDEGFEILNYVNGTASRNKKIKIFLRDPLDFHDLRKPKTDDIRP